MKRILISSTFSFAVLFSLLLFTSTKTAHAALPADILQSISQAAAQANQAGAAPVTGQPQVIRDSLEWVKARRAQDSRINALGSVVVSAISSRPDLVSEIISTAVSAAPGSAPHIARHTAHVFPGFAPVIAQSAGLPLSSIRTSAWTDYTSSPSYQTVVARTPAPPAPTVYRPVYPVAQSTLPAPRPVDQVPQKPVPPTKRIIAEDQKIAPGYHGAEEVSDPIEGLNRFTAGFNDAIDTMILRPISAVYGYVMPPAAKPPVRRFFKNLTSPVIFVNDLVQLEGTDAAVTAGRFVINSTVGVLGLFDMATDFGLEEHHADFGQTLHSYGVGPGPYIVLPVLGPSNLRDGTGKVVDYFVDPFNYILKADLQTARTAGSALSTREGLIPTLTNLKDKSLDYYATLRAAYYQNRVLQLNKGRAGLAPVTSQQTDDLFDDAE